MDHYVSKPIGPRALSKAMAETLERRREIARADGAAPPSPAERPPADRRRGDLARPPSGPIDWGSALAAFDGDRSLLTVAAQAFLEEHTKLVRAIRDAVDRRDARTVHIQRSTRLKAALRYFGPTQAGALAAELEQLAAGGTLSGAAAVLDRLIAPSATIPPAICRYLESRPRSEIGDAPAGGALSTTAWHNSGVAGGVLGRRERRNVRCSAQWRADDLRAERSSTTATWKGFYDLWPGRECSIAKAFRFALTVMAIQKGHAAVRIASGWNTTCDRFPFHTPGPVLAEDSCAVRSEQPTLPPSNRAARYSPGWRSGISFGYRDRPDSTRRPRSGTSPGASRRNWRCASGPSAPGPGPAAPL